MPAVIGPEVEYILDRVASATSTPTANLESLVLSSLTLWAVKENHSRHTNMQTPHGKIPGFKPVTFLL